MKFSIVTISLLFSSIVTGRSLLDEGNETGGVKAGFNCLANCTVSTIGDDCFQLTDDIKRQTGVVWSTDPLTIANSFVVEVAMYFGSNDGPTWNGTGTPNDPGADGIAFVLQNQGPDTVGKIGGGLGYAGISPSLTVELDTYQNKGASDDPAEDHVALVRDGISVDGILEGPNQLNTNLENGAFHNVTFEWLSDMSTITVYLNGTIVLTSSAVNMTDILQSDLAFMGFTSSTGESSNVHEVCVRSIRSGAFALAAPTPAPTAASSVAFGVAAPSLSQAPSLSPAPSSMPSINSAPSCMMGKSGGKSGKAGTEMTKKAAKNGKNGKNGKNSKSKSSAAKGPGRLRRLKGNGDDDDDDRNVECADFGDDFGDEETEGDNGDGDGDGETSNGTEGVYYNETLLENAGAHNDSSETTTTDSETAATDSDSNSETTTSDRGNFRTASVTDASACAQTTGFVGSVVGVMTWVAILL